MMLIDLDLKTQCGLEVAEKLQWFAPTLAVPMILIFSDDLASTDGQVEALHNYLFLAKPVSIQALMQAVVEAADLV
ncbi:MAG: hypothetical protein JNM04_06260 [Chthonomonas sp.]|nr:hypothetical protein [Chthonomonas sp.]